MQTHELLQPDPLRPEYRKRCRLPAYDVERGKPKYLLSEDGESIFQIVHAGQVIVPLVDREGHDLPNLAMALIEAALMEREGPSLEAASAHGAILEGARALDDLDLELEVVLVRTGTEVPAICGLKSVAHHADVEPDLVICLPNPQFLGMMPTVDDVSFGMLLHNPDAIIPVRLMPN